MKRRHLFKKKNIIYGILMSTMFAAAVTIIVYAMYTNSSYKKGVISTAQSSVLFSSDYLDLYKQEEELPQKTIGVMTEEGSTDADFCIHIRNYAENNLDAWNQNDISYQLTITLTDSTVDTIMASLNGEEFSFVNGTARKTGTLSAAGRNQDELEIRMPDEWIGKVGFTVTAVPEKTSDTEGYSLGAVLMPAFVTGGKTEFACTGKLTNESTVQDAFTYEVSITTGKANVTVTWDPEKVEMDSFFIDEMVQEGKVSVQTDRSITFQMDAAVQNTELITFYQTNGSVDDVGGMITCTGTEI